MLTICVIYLLLLTWCQCDDQSTESSKRYDDSDNHQQGKSTSAGRLHHFGHYGRIIVSPTVEAEIDQSPMIPEESSSDLMTYRQSEMFDQHHNRPTIKKRKKTFHQAIKYAPHRRWDHHHLDDYRHQNQLYPYQQHQQFERRGYEDFHLFNGGHYGGMDRSDFYYVLPILLVIGLGAFLIPIITTFFTALVTSNTALCGRRKRNDHFVLDWKPLLQEKVLEMWTTVERAVQAGLQKYGNNPGANDSLNQLNNYDKNVNSTSNNGGKSNHFYNS
jgi:hypothetical protein